MIRLKHYLTRKGRMRPFLAAVAVAALVLPAVEAFAFFSSTGSGSSTATAGTASTVAIQVDPGNPSPIYGGPSASALVPGGTVTQALMAKCLTSCPAYVTTVNLAGWSSDKTGCDATTLPGSFTMPALTVNQSIIAGGTPIGSAVITFVNLAVDQTACAGATLTFNFTTP